MVDIFNFIFFHLDKFLLIPLPQICFDSCNFFKLTDFGRKKFVFQPRPEQKKIVGGRRRKYNFLIYRFNGCKKI